MFVRPHRKEMKQVPASARAAAAVDTPSAQRAAAPPTAATAASAPATTTGKLPPRQPPVPVGWCEGSTDQLPSAEVSVAVVAAAVDCIGGGPAASAQRPETMPQRPDAAPQSEGPAAAKRFRKSCSSPPARPPPPWRTAGTGARAYSQLTSHIVGADTAALQKMLAGGVPADLKSKTGRLPLCVAAHWGRPDAVRALIAAGADPSQADSKGRTPLQCAQDTLAAFLVKGRDVQSVDAAITEGGKMYPIRRAEIELAIGSLASAARLSALKRPE